MADEYTPTTEQVRGAYAWFDDSDDEGIRAAEFDRWLAQHDREVAARALVDAQASLHTLYDEMGDPDPDWVLGIQSAARKIRDLANRVEKGDQG